MESPVRIFFGAALVVNLLLLCNAPVEGIAIPNDIRTTTVKNEAPKFKSNITLAAREQTKTPDVALNELSVKPAEEHTDKNAKYKDRGRVKFGPRISTTAAPKSTSSAETVTLVIVTPTPEVKRPAQIIHSMKNFKKTKMPFSTTSPVTPVPSSSEESEEKDDSYEKFTSSKYLDNFFSIPSFDNENGYSQEIDNDGSNKKVKKDNKKPYEFPNYSKEDSYNYKVDKEPFKSSFFNYDSKLTTPKNDFFDKRHKKISSSIINKLDQIKAKSPPSNVTNIHKIVHENIGIDRMNNTPSNKSSIYFKNTKEIRLSDNEGAGTANKEFSDVQGTSVYYEMSVLSTNTYTMDQSNEDDCDENTESTTVPNKDVLNNKVKTTEPTLDESKPTQSDKKSKTYPISASNSISVSTMVPFFSTLGPFPYSTISYSLDDRITKLFPNRNRTYAKRLNLNGFKESPNSVTPKSETSYTIRPQTRSKFRSTTPRTKPVWMAPKRNLTRVYTTSPKTIYSEHFSISEKPTIKPLVPSKTVLTTISSAEIDPVFQTDSSGTSKVVNSQFVTDNTIPSLRKRGSTRYKLTTPASAEVDSNLAELEMPSTAWALASLISPPSLPTSVVNATEIELQKVGDIIDNKETTVSSTTSTASHISNDIVTKKVTEVELNRLPWQPMSTQTESSNYNKNTIGNGNKIISEQKETLTAESNISVQSSAEPATTEPVKENTVDAEISIEEKVKPLNVPATVETLTTTEKNEMPNITNNESVQPINTTRSTGFESITKLPADVTTPQDETVPSSIMNQTFTEKPKATTDFEITTIRFSYGTTETPEEETEDTTNTIPDETTSKTTHKYVLPTRTITTTVKDVPITTYRPTYVFTTDMEEATTVLPDTTPIFEVSSQIMANVTELPPAVTTESTEQITESTEQTTESTEQTTESTEQTTEYTEQTTEIKTHPIEDTTETVITTVSIPTTTTKATPTAEPTQTTYIPEETTTTVVHVVTEINTEKSTIITPSPSTIPITSTETGTSEENSHSNEITYDETVPSEKPEPTTIKSKSTQATTTVDDRISNKETTVSVDATENKDVSKFASEEEINEATTEAVGRGPEEAGSGAAVAIAVSTIGVIALVLLIGLLLVVRRRGRRGVYAQRCTPVSLDAYSLDSVSVGHRKGNTRLRASKRSYGNPAYDDEVTSHPMHYQALASFALDVDSMCAEFAEIPNVTVKGEEVPPGCEDKNRYSNVLPLPETRVPLQRINNDPTTEYINANFVAGPGNIRNYYILAQAPLSNTVVDFWRMIWEQNSRLVVMLTEYMENGVEKCYEYLPPSEVSDNKRSFGDFTIILKKREQRDKYAISTIHVVNLATRTWREVMHLWYFWPAKGVPEDYDSVIDFLFEMRSYMKVAQTAKEYDEEGVEVIYGDLNRSSFNNLSKLREENGSSNGVNVYSPARAEEQHRRTNNGTLSRMKAASEVENIRPCVVTCASGAGRSAALAALDVCSRALGGAGRGGTGRVGGGAGRADVPRAVRTLRTMRPHALPNRHHYMWLYKVLSEYGNKILGGADDI